jgi:predicted CXXCH cytochrome family protein
MRRPGLWVLYPCLSVFISGYVLLRAQPPQQRDPAAWGGDHVGKPLPEYVTGDECLFCHRNDVGPGWGKNRHQLTVRPVEADAVELAELKKVPALRPFADEVKLLLGRGQRARFLKPGKAYGHLDLLATERPHWDEKRFADRCAGCHATAVEVKTRAFAALSLDCFVCHGDVPANHAKDTTLAYLSKKRQDSPRVVTSICAQCHVRTGTSQSTGLPYPHHFVAGDNLFKDFRVDLSPEALAKVNPLDRHVLENVRDVVRLGKEDVTCLSCHDVHKGSSRKHYRLAERDACLTCHQATGPKKDVKPCEVHSTVCGY